MQDIGRLMLTMAFRWLPLIIVTALAAGGVAYAFASSQEDVYEATATLRVDPGPSATTQHYDAARDALAQYALEGESRAAAQDVIKALGLDAGIRDVQERINLTADEEGLILEISAEANDPQEARQMAQRTGNQLRLNVNGALITDQVRAADRAISANKREIQRYTRRIQGLQRKSNKTEDDRAEMQAISSLLLALRAENVRLEPSSREWVRNRLIWRDTPRSPTTSSNRPLYWALLAMVVGGMLGASLAFVLDMLRGNTRVRDLRDLEEATGLPALGSISERRGDIRRGPAERLVVLRHPRSESANAYRRLLTKIGFASSSARSLMVASHDGSDDMKVVAANIALAYADAGRTTLLVDADYRSPRLHQLFGVANDRGLTDLLANRNVPLGFVTTPSPHPRMGLMLAGPPPPATAEALSTPVLNALLRRLLQAADVVVFASPAIASSLDATALAGSLDECVLVVPTGANADDIVEAAATVERSRVGFAGAVLYKRIRGSHARTAAAALPPPQTRWVPKADPVPDDLRLTAGSPPRAQEPPARTETTPKHPAPPTRTRAPERNEGRGLRPTGASQPAGYMAVPVGPVPPEAGNGHGTNEATIQRDHPAVARPEPAVSNAERDRSGSRDEPAGDPGTSARTDPRASMPDGGPYQAPFAPNPPVSTKAASGR